MKSNYLCAASFIKKTFLSIAAVALLASGFFVPNLAGATVVPPVVLGVTQITAVQTYAVADNTFEHGWRWVFDVTVPENENILKMKFDNWFNGTDTILAQNNIRFFSSQSSNASTAASAIVIADSNTYSGDMNIVPTVDLKDLPGRQIQITVEVKVPVGKSGGSYSTSYGIKSEVDGIAPVITLIGDNPQTIERGTGYVELGATAMDNIDGAVVVVSDHSSVNTDVAGAYETTYSAFDSAGNHASASRTVNVVDTISPTATVSYSTTDPTNQDVVATITPSETVTGDLTHTFTDNGSFTFNFTDFSGNAGSLTATVTNIDRVHPEVSITSPAGGAYLKGTVAVTADASDVSGISKVEFWHSSPVGEKIGEDSSAPYSVDWNTASVNDGPHDIWAVAYDNAGNVKNSELVSVTVDNTAPIITVTSDISMSLPTNQNITVTPSTNEGTLNVDVYTFTSNGSFDFVSQDLAGNVTTKTVTITNIDKQAPVISSYTLTVSGKDPTPDNNVFISYDNGVKIRAKSNETSKFDLWIYNSSGIEKLHWVTGSDTNFVKPGDCYWKGGTTQCAGDKLPDGVYSVKLDVTDIAGNVTTDTSKTVIIDNTKPVIASHADVLQNVATHVGANVTYTLPTVTDADSSVLAVCTPVSGSMFSYGDTTVTCSATDSAGNQATPTTFKVTVTDNILPTLTVNGFTANGIAMSGSISSGYTLNTDNSPDTHNLIQFASGSSASEDLQTENVGLFLQPTGTQTADLQTYYSTKPDGWKTYLNAAAAGTEPFAYIKTGGTTIKLLDGAQEFLAHTELDMIVPGDYPLGTYTVKGTIHDIAGNATNVTYILIVAGDRIAPEIHLVGANPQIIEYGLSYTELGATVTDNHDVGLVATNDAGAVVKTNIVGTYTVTYNATDVAGNHAIPVTRTVNVIKATPTVTWANQADITIGTALGIAQLNATASVDGTFAYTPVPGTVLGLGDNQLLSVTFTPNDSTNYNNVSATSHINVINPYSLSVSNTHGNFAPFEAILPVGDERLTTDGTTAVNDTNYFSSRGFKSTTITLNKTTGKAVYGGNITIPPTGITTSQMWAFSPVDNAWYDVNYSGFGGASGVPASAYGDSTSIDVYVISSLAQDSTIPITLKTVGGGSPDTTLASANVIATITNPYSFVVSGNLGNVGTSEQKINSGGVDILTDGVNMIHGATYFSSKGYKPVTVTLNKLSGFDPYLGYVTVPALNLSSGIQMWAYSAQDDLWFDFNTSGFGGADGKLASTFPDSFVVAVYVISPVSQIVSIPVDLKSVKDGSTIKSVTASVNIVNVTHTITIDKNISGGTIGLIVNNNGNQTVTITPNGGFHIVEVLVDGLPLSHDSMIWNGEVANYTFTNIISDHTISATFTN